MKFPRIIYWTANSLRTDAHLDLDFALLGGLFRNDDRSHHGLKPIETSLKFIGPQRHATYPESTMFVSRRLSYFSFIAGTLDFK
ncbi:MAG TPA: hypothetical protein VN881_00860 [Candidatus Acidoferrales bacterium]|nr:hypothetical protein [Candidatus Acidoferrales bacterium]